MLLLKEQKDSTNTKTDHAITSNKLRLWSGDDTSQFWDNHAPTQSRKKQRLK